MHVIGVTGGIGSGKSSLSAALREQGAVVLDADRISHEVTGAGQPAVAEIAELLGAEVLEADGTLNRRAVAERIFNAPELKRRLEGIIHGRVIDRFENELARLAGEGAEWVVLDVPIPIERGFRDLCGSILTVDADDGLRTERVMRRSGLARDQVAARMAAQPSRAEYAAIADCVVVNDGSEQVLARAAAMIFGWMREGKSLPGSLVLSELKWYTGMDNEPSRPHQEGIKHECDV